jgi:hypothetical protein
MRPLHPFNGNSSSLTYIIEQLLLLHQYGMELETRQTGAPNPIQGRAPNQSAAESNGFLSFLVY